MDRRDFVALSAILGASAVSTQLRASGPLARQTRKPVLVRAGYSRKPDGTDELRSVQQTVVRSFDSEGRFAAFAVPPTTEATYHGAPLHLHHELDEWLYILSGEFVAEVGGERFRLKQGDSLLMPMRVPHRWSRAGLRMSGAIHLYTPAGLMDVSWDPTPDDNKPLSAPEEKAEFEKYGMTLLGPQLTQEEILKT